MCAPDADELREESNSTKNSIRFGEAVNRVIVFTDALLFLADKVQHERSIAYWLLGIEY